MALLWIDGFEGYGTSNGSAPSPTGVVSRRYIASGESSMDIEAGRITDHSLEFSSNTVWIKTPALTTDDTLIIGFGFRCSDGSTFPFCNLYDDSTQGINIRWENGTGELQIRRGSTILGTTSGLGLLPSKWYWVELKVVCHDTTGSYELHVGGVNVLSASGIDTKAGSNNYHNHVQFVGYISKYLRIDDLYICDGSGSLNNDFLGNCKVTTIFPDGVGTTTEWAPNAGANYECVDENPADDDTTYVEDSVTNQLDLYAYADATGLDNIKGLQINVDCRETDATSYDIKIPIRSGGSNYDDSAQTVGSTDYLTKMRVAETDPNTSVAWVANGISAAEFGVKVG